MNASSLETPRLPQTTEVAPTLTGSLEICGLRGDARRPRRIEVVRRIEHRVRVHRHPMLAGHGLEERADGIFPAASGHPRPLFSHGLKSSNRPPWRVSISTLSGYRTSKRRTVGSKPH